MLNWRSILATDFIPKLQGDGFWEIYMHKLLDDTTSLMGLHLAVFVEPYLGYILEEKKTVESRFSVHRLAPYGQVAVGDVILLKRSSGPVLGICRISNVWFYKLKSGSLGELRTEFTEALCAQDPSFWKQREKASYATLMGLASVKSLEPILFPKRDRRGWVVLRSSRAIMDNQSQ